MTEGTVMETDSGNLLNYNVPMALLLNTLSSSVSNADSNKQCFFYASRGFEIMDTSGSAEKSIEPICVSSSGAYQKKLTSDVNFALEEGDKTEMFALAELVSNHYGETDKISKVVLFGSNDFLDLEYDSYVANANSNLFMHVITSLIAPTLVTDIPVKPYTFSIITVSAGVRTFYLALWILSSIALVIAGTVIVILRSRN